MEKIFASRFLPVFAACLAERNSFPDSDRIITTGHSGLEPETYALEGRCSIQLS